MIEFTEAAAVYFIGHVGAQVVQRFQQTGLPILQRAKPGDRPGPVSGDRLRVVTHSLGSVILFDLLFAARWDDPMEKQHRC